MKDKLFKKRKSVDWNSLRLSIEDFDFSVFYWSNFRNWSSLNDNRRSYIALLRYYGKARLDAYRASGVWL